MQFGMYETATRALEVIFVREGGKDDGGETAKSIEAVLKALDGKEDGEENPGAGSMGIVWDDGYKTVLDFLSNREFPPRREGIS
jgi:hypothetical protein